MKTTAQNCSRSAEMIRTCVTLITGRIVIFSAAALLVVLWPSGVSADDRSFPAEITGTIRSFDKATQTFTIQVDEPARVFTIAVGSDCEFKENGAPTGEQILKQGARVEVSYFATIFTGNIAVDSATNPVPEVNHEITEKRRPAQGTLSIRRPGDTYQRGMPWPLNAFYKG
jgi:hypothetical protein